ncbi:glycerophosphodiester phosphodiesterase [Psychroflexus sp. YR1-1]|uniref:Glycerophosphodiester phosphodiesterase n=1 Tax=Psychroflexus aurantiacus TaxID=2709310 RepID=A0A6B3QZA1_9FLAO|nr:thioredoxin family protein [Psychroflexus aurantiacus]NEV93068.1 glycerophosphodiester phosphodiesterase [Psychroflexus aurantiacus]
MKKIIAILTVLTLSLGFSSFISSEFTRNNKTELQDYKLLLGDFTLEELKSTVNKTWFNSQYEPYTPNAEVIDQLKSELKNTDFHISVYMGTWCPDSRREFPHLIKILNQADFDLNHLRIVGVDRDKVIPNATEDERKKINILNVPTIIVYDENGKEINRFVEFPQETLEKDLLKIFSGEDYKHVYDF